MPVTFPPGPGEAVDKPGPLWIAECDHHNRNRGRRGLRGLSSGGGGHRNDVRFEAQTFCDEPGEPFVVTVGGKVVDRNGPLIQIAEVLKALEEGSEAW